MNEFEVYPAIDLRQGRVVRLRQGDPAQETAYDHDALAVARRWQEAGARWLHVVNLDGALDDAGAQSRPPYGGTTNLRSRPAEAASCSDVSPQSGDAGGENWAALERILGTGLRVQFGGGLRDLESLRRVLELGVCRAVLGTAAVEGPTLVEAALATFGPERIAVAIDARRGRVRTHGWQQDSALTAVELAQRCAELGVLWIIHTDVARDGMGRGLNVEASRQLAQKTGAWGSSGQRLHIIASGGVASLGDVQHAQEAGLSGVIIGRALYEGSVRLEDALGLGRMQGSSNVDAKGPSLSCFTSFSISGSLSETSVGLMGSFTSFRMTDLLTLGKLR